MASYRDTRIALRTLTATATQQGGYFTSKQARDAGYDYPHIEYHLKAGNFERIGHGLYRLPNLPRSENDDLIRLSLWSRDRGDSPQAVVSHETALGLYGLGELIPAKTHLSVPKNFRKKAPNGCVLHKADLTKKDQNEREGYRITTPIRTLLDIAASNTVPQEQLDKAVIDALNQGLVRRVKLIEAMQSHPATKRLSQSLQKKR